MDSSMAQTSGIETTGILFLHKRAGSPSSVSSIGTITSTPVVSPTHQVIQFNGTFEAEITPPASSTPVAVEALTRQLAGPPKNRNFDMLFPSSSADGNPTCFVIRNAPANACNDAPTAIKAATGVSLSNASGPCPSDSDALSKKEPSHTPGQYFMPYSRRMVNAMPEEGNMAEA